MKRILCLTLLLSACGPAANDSGPGGISVEDARALDAAAEKLDNQVQVQSINPPVQKAGQAKK